MPQVDVLHPGQRVRKRSSREQVGTVVSGPKRIAGQDWYAVSFGGPRVSHIPAFDLEVFAAGRTVEELLREGIYASKDTLSNLLTFTKLQFPVRNNVYALRATRTRFLHYQFKPLLKFLNSPKQRLLIADEVGLGKTIEAGLILTELRARLPGSLDRVLIVCPSALCRKWKTEMKARFDEEFTILDSEGMRTFLADLEANGEGTKLRGICSIQTLRGRQLLEEWNAASPELDFLIIDEAHHLRNPDTHSHRMGRLIAEGADSVLLLTATPVHLGNVNLFYLFRILDPEQFGSNPDALRDDAGELLFQRLVKANEPIVEALRVVRSVPADLSRCEALLRKAIQGEDATRFRANPVIYEILEKLPTIPPTDVGQLIELQRDIAGLNLFGAVLTRTRKREVETRVIREPRAIVVHWTPVEQQLYHSITQSVLDRYHLIEGDPFATFMVMMPQRQVASCIPAAIERYEQTTSVKVGGLGDELSDLEIEDWSNGSDRSDTEIGAPDLHAAIREWRDAGSPDTKFIQLLSTLRMLDSVEPGRKLVLFSYFKGTLYYLRRRLTNSGYSTEVITGDYSDEERQESIARFQDDPHVRILLSSEVGSEGLDFQFCHMMVNYDLPWNPMVVEQRIGRLDRIGQTSEKIIIFNFSVPGTIEDRILTRLYQRIRIFEESIGDLEPILGEEIKNLTRDLLRSGLSAEQQDARIQQTAEVLERRRQEMAQLEEGSTRFIGHDEFFSDELERVLKRRRFVSGDELRTLIVHFFEKHHHDCSVDRNGDDYDLVVTSTLERFVVEYVDQDDPLLFNFRRRCGKGRIPVTFDSERAERDREVDFINSYHPLVRAIVRYYDRCPEELHPVAKLQLERAWISNNPAGLQMSVGDYFYFVYRLDAAGVRHDRSLQPFFVHAETLQVLAGETAEELLSTIAAHARTLDSAVPAYRTGVIDAVQDRADEVFGEYLEGRRRELSKRNDAVVNARLVSLEQSAAARIGRREQQLAEAAARNARPQYLRLLEGTLRRLKLDYEQRRTEMEKGRALELTFERVAAGLLCIHPDENGNGL